MINSKTLKISSMLLVSVLLFLPCSSVSASDFWEPVNKFEERFIPSEPTAAGKAATAAVYGALALPLISIISGSRPGFDALAYGASLGVSHLVKEAGKSLTQRQRPDSSSSDSFPSGHAAAAGTALGYTLYMSSRREDPLHLSLAASITLQGAVSLGRVISREHYPSDVLAGLLLGLAAGWGIPAAADLIFNR